MGHSRSLGARLVQSTRCRPGHGCRWWPQVQSQDGVERWGTKNHLRKRKQGRYDLITTLDIYIYIDIDIYIYIHIYI